MIMIFNTAQRWYDKNHLTVTFVTNQFFKKIKEIE